MSSFLSSIRKHNFSFVMLLGLAVVVLVGGYMFYQQRAGAFDLNKCPVASSCADNHYGIAQPFTSSDSNSFERMTLSLVSTYNGTATAELRKFTPGTQPSAGALLASTSNRSLQIQQNGTAFNLLAAPAIALPAGSYVMLVKLSPRSTISTMFSELDTPGLAAEYLDSTTWKVFAAPHDGQMFTFALNGAQSTPTPSPTASSTPTASPTATPTPPANSNNPFAGNTFKVYRDSTTGNGQKIAFLFPQQTYDCTVRNIQSSCSYAQAYMPTGGNLVLQPGSPKPVQIKMSLVELTADQYTSGNLTGYKPVKSWTFNQHQDQCVDNCDDWQGWWYLPAQYGYPTMLGWKFKIWGDRPTLTAGKYYALIFESTKAGSFWALADTVPSTLMAGQIEAAPKAVVYATTDGGATYSWMRSATSRLHMWWYEPHHGTQF